MNSSFPRRRQSGKGETAFRFPAPYLKDAEGKPGAVSVILEAQAEGCRMICQPDQEYLATAVYPVSLDPAVQTSQDSAGIVDTFVYQGYSTNFSGYSVLGVSNNASYGLMNTYLRVQTLPSLGSNHFITGAKVCLLTSTPTYQQNGSIVLAKEVMGSWTPSTITYASQPTLGSVYQDAWYMPYNTYAWTEFDVTAPARKWYAGDNKGIALVPDPSAADAIGLYSSESSYKPYFVVNYSSLGGLEEYLSYDSQPVGRAGAGFVSLHNGNLVFAHGDTAMNGARLPVSVTHYYNSCDADKNDFFMGKGWKTSLHQTLHKALLNSAVYYVYTDGDGTQHYFESANSSNTEYKDMSGLSLKLVPGNPTTITDKGDNVMTFPQITATPTASAPTTARVQMTKMQDAKGNQITIAATGLKITSVTDGAGRVTAFDYSNNLCSAIRTPWQTASSCTRFTYSGSKLTQVTYEDGKTSSFGYADVGSFSLLTSAAGPEGYQAAYTYTAANVTSGLPHYVSRAMVNAGSQKVSDAEYTYGHLLSKVKDNISGKSLRYHFNENGNQVSVDDELGYGRYTKYARSGSNANAPINHATERSRMQRVVTNLLVDGMLDDNSSAWVQGGTGTFTRDVANFKWGVVSQKIAITSGNTAYKRQAVTLTPGKSYTFSAYVMSGAPKAFLRLMYTISGTNYYVDSDPVQVGTPFQRLAVSFTLPSNASATVYCCMMCSTTAGNAWFDCLQLEEGLTLNHFNMLQNSNFANGSGTLPNSWIASYSSSYTFAQTIPFSQCSETPPSFLTGRAIRVSSLYYATTGAHQQFRAEGKAGDRIPSASLRSALLRRPESPRHCAVQRDEVCLYS